MQQGVAPSLADAPARCGSAPHQPSAVNSSRVTHHRLGCKHVFVPELEVFHIFQDDLLVFPALEEVCAADDRGGPRGLVPLDVHRGGLVVGLNPPGEDRECAGMGEEGSRSKEMVWGERAAPLGALWVAVTCHPAVPHPHSAG